MKNLYSNKKNAFLITNKFDRRYLLGYDVSEGYLLLSDKLHFFTDARYFDGVKNVLSEKGVSVYLYKSLDTIKDFVISNGIEKLYIDFNTETVSAYNSYKDFGIEVLDLSEKIYSLRSIKSEEELSLIKKSCEICQKTFYNVLPKIKKGVTEKQIKFEIEKLFIINGADDKAFETIVAFNENGAVPHHVSSDKILEENMSVLIDMGCSYNGYCSDLTRTMFFGKPPLDFIEIYNHVKKANEIAIENIKEKCYTDNADGFARQYLQSVNLDKYFTHSLGHGVGLEIHEYPYLSPKKKHQLLNGMVFSIEPGVYIESKFGIRIEDTVALVDGKIERFFTDDKQLILIK